MSYPVLPMALVTFLANVSKQRSELPKGPTHVTTIVHHGENVRASRFAVEVSAHWDEVIERTITAYNEGAVDTVTFIYPTVDGDPVDYGIILEGGRKPFFFEWTYSPVFDIRLVSADVQAQISGGVGVKIMQELLDRDARMRTPGGAILAASSAVNTNYFAGMGDPTIAGSGSA